MAGDLELIEYGSIREGTAVFKLQGVEGTVGKYYWGIEMKQLEEILATLRKEQEEYE